MLMTDDGLQGAGTSQCPCQDLSSIEIAMKGTTKVTIARTHKVMGPMTGSIWVPPSAPNISAAPMRGAQIRSALDPHRCVGKVSAKDVDGLLIAP